MRTLLIGLLLGALAVTGQEPDSRVLARSTFEEQPALVMANDRLQLTIIRRGGALANLTLRDDPSGLSPFWNPARLARESGQRRVSGPTFGHFVCVDGFGPVSEEERAAGLPGHGEAHLQPWDPVSAAKEGGVTTATFRVQLPILQERFTRTFRMVDGENVIYVESRLENELGFDRPVCWAEHATIGSPFLEPGVTVIDMSARRARTRPHPANPAPLPRRLASSEDFTWPMAPGIGGATVNLRLSPEEGGTIDHSACLMDASRKLVFVTALNPARRLVFGYLFHPDEYPWTQNWENYPASLKWARGMEFSTQPFDVPRREVIQMNSMFGVPVYRWLPAKSTIGSRFLLFYAHAPEGFRQVDDVRLEGGRILIEDHAAGKQIVLSASGPV